MIVGVGVDLVATARIERAWNRFGDRFAGKILAAAEHQLLKAASNPVAFLAKQFAAKEAVSKALGTGMGAGVHFRQIIVTRLRSGAPAVEMTGPASARAQSLGAARCWISISDEPAQAIAFAVLETA